MRTDSHRLAGTLVALGFLAGWFSASWLSPPTAATQVAPARAVPAVPDVPMPRIALDAVRAPETTPATTRNPFVFSGGRPTPHADAPRLARAMPAGDDALAAEAPPDAPPADASPVPTWRVFGIAADADGRHTAVVSGGGDVFLLAVGDRLPDGAEVVEIDAGGLVLTSAGVRLTLRLP